MSALHSRTLAVRLDSDGDVLLTGPAIRALGRLDGSGSVDLLASPQGAAAAAMLPGVARVLRFAAPWSGFAPPPVDSDSVRALLAKLTEAAYQRTVIFTSFHQSPLPMALLARLAGIGWVGADSVDYPGSLLDLRHRRAVASDGGDIHEVNAALDLAVAAGGALPAGDDGRLAVRLPPDPAVDAHPIASDALTSGNLTRRYVVVHPGASVPSRAMDPGRAAATVRALARQGWDVVVTGGPGETGLTAPVSGAAAGREPGSGNVIDLGGRTDLPGLARVLGSAACVVVGNTGPAHLAAAVGTPVVSLFAPVVPVRRWRPYGVASVLLGDQQALCRDSRARECPVVGHPCLAGVTEQQVVAAVDRLTGGPGAADRQLTPAHDQPVARRIAEVIGV